MTAVLAKDLHSSDCWHYRAEFDLTVVRTFRDGASVAVIVEQYQFPLHVAADAVLDVDVAATT
jgi:hypothetical protein